MTALLPPAIALVATILLCRSFTPVAHRIDLVDRPGGRKRHEGAVPLVGGIAIAIGTTLGVLLIDASLGSFRSLFIGVLILLVTGILDDFRELSAAARLTMQVTAALAMALWGGVVLQDFGALIGGSTLGLGFLAVPLTVFAVAGVINAVNMVDGVDGLAGSTVAVCLLGLLALGIRAGAGPGAAVIGVLLGAITGFLAMNLRWRASGRAHVFLGDAGSMTLGFMLAWLLVRYSQGDARWFAPVSALWLLAVPLIDTIFVMGSRVARGLSPFSGGRDHFHHLFLRAGFGVRQTWALHVLASLACAGVGLGMHVIGVPDHWQFVAFLVVALGYAVIISRAWRQGRWLGRPVADG